MSLRDRWGRREGMRVHLALMIPYFENKLIYKLIHSMSTSYALEIN